MSISEADIERRAKKIFMQVARADLSWDANFQCASLSEQINTSVASKSIRNDYYTLARAELEVETLNN